MDVLSSSETLLKDNVCPLRKGRNLKCYFTYRKHQDKIMDLNWLLKFELLQT